MKPHILLIGAIIAIAVAFFVFREASEGPAEQAGEAVDNVVNEAAEAVETATE